MCAKALRVLMEVKAQEIFQTAIVPPPEIPVSPTCESEAICPPGLVGYGSWPECACKYPDQPNPPPGGGGSPEPPTYYPGLGGVDNCNAMFTCPPRMLMDVDESGTCVCK